MAISMKYDEALFQVALRNCYGDPTVEVLSVDGDLGTTGIGNHNLSEITRIRIKFTIKNGTGLVVNKTKSFILKREPGKDSGIFHLIQAEQFFAVEHRVFREILPRIESFLGVRLGPNLIYGTDELPRTIIMEDLIPQGFCVVNTHRGLSMAHAKMAIQNLARFHAGSVLLWEENPEALKSFKQGSFNATTPPNMFVLIAKSLDLLCKDAMSWSDGELRYQLAAKKLMPIIDSVEDRILDVYECEDNEFCVLNHGDAWINNMMFREDEAGNPLEQVFIDYQMVRFCSPALDLLYFFSMNPALEVRGEGEEVLLKIYLDTLTSSMDKLRCKTATPTMRHLKESMHKRRIFAVVSSLFLLPQMLLDEEDTESIGQLLQNGTFRVNPYKNLRTIHMMKRILPQMNDRGYLDPHYVVE